MDEQELRRNLAEKYRDVARSGLNELASGNMSVRFEDGMIISPTGATGEGVTPEDFVLLSLDGETGSEGRPSSEWQMHAEIYRACSSAGAVVHTHSDYCVAVSCHNKPLPGFHYLVGSFGGKDVPCVPYSTFGTQQLAMDAAAALDERTACLLGNHGMICRGADLDQAVRFAHRLEIMCRQYVLARQLGEPSLLSDAEWEEFFAKAEDYSLT